MLAGHYTARVGSGRLLAAASRCRRPASCGRRLLVTAKSGKWGNENRLGPGGGGSNGRPPVVSEINASMLVKSVESSFLRSVDAPDDPPPPQPAWHQALARKLGEWQYNYFNWRQDTWSDLQLFIVLNVFVFLAGAWIEGAVIRHMDDSVGQLPEGVQGPLHTLWYNLYKVLAVVLGQDLPADQAGWPSQLFAIITAVFGLASFALVLALIEQVVLEVLENNVKRGSTCFESGHTVVLSWCESSRDIAQLTRILTQLCAANRRHGGGVVVVLTQQRGKLEMEQLFREVVPEQHRYRTRLVFRQGSPLDPVALHMVAATDARRIIVCGDYARSSKDADAQVLRTCVLLDEEIQRQRPSGAGGPVVVAQIKTEDALPLVRYSCSPRVLPVPTNKVNARRYVRLLHHPIAAVFSRCLTDFYSPAHGTIDRVPEADGLAFGDLHCHFPDALVVGLTNRRSGYYQLNPPPERVVELGDELILLRPERDGVGLYQDLPAGVPVASGSNWSPSRYVMRSQDEQPLGADACGRPSVLSQSARAHGGALMQACYLPAWEQRLGTWASLGSSEPYQGSAQGLFVLPVQYSSPLSGGELLICGWMGHTFMWELLAELDHSDQALPIGSKVTLFHEHAWNEGGLEAGLQRYSISNLDVRWVRGDPRSRADMQRLVDLSKYKAAIVVCDSHWVDQAGGDVEGGITQMSQADMLSCDAAVLMVQLNIRLLLEEVGHPSISIICEKLTYVGVTRFEDDTRLPLGIAVNSASYAAKTLTQVAVNPRFLRAYMQLGAESDLMVQDASAFVDQDEALSFLQLQARAASVRQVLLGYYRIPGSPAEPLEMVVNPQGLELRSQPRVWNEGDSRLKLVTMVFVKQRSTPAAEARRGEMEGPMCAGSSSDDEGAAPAGSTASGSAASASWAPLASGSASASGSGSEEPDWQEAAAEFGMAAKSFVARQRTNLLQDAAAGAAGSGSLDGSSTEGSSAGGGGPEGSRSGSGGE